MQTAAKAAVSAAQKPSLDVSNTAQFRDLAASAARIFGWDAEKVKGPRDTYNTLVVTQDQLEQIRQLREA